jgi:hypothetical protein
MVAKKSFTNSTPKSFGGSKGLDGFLDRCECNSERREGTDLPETDFESGENSLRSSSIPSTKVSTGWPETLPDDAAFLMEFI